MEHHERSLVIPLKRLKVQASMTALEFAREFLQISFPRALLLKFRSQKYLPLFFQSMILSMRPHKIPTKNRCKNVIKCFICRSHAEHAH